MSSSNQVTRKLSLWRLGFALLVFFGLIAGSYLGARQVIANRAIASIQPWFAPYVDVTATPTFNFQYINNNSERDAILSFIVSSPTSACTPTWGAAYTLAQADNSLNLETRIARLQQQGGSVAISFGGRNNQELAVNCTNETALYNAYSSVITHYHINTIDLDLEGSGLNSSIVNTRRAIVIAKLQKNMRASGHNLAVWVTLPVTPQGLDQSGTNAVAELLSHGVDLAGVNIMTMDYGSSLQSGQNMLSASESAAIQTERQLGILYNQVKIHLNAQSLWRKIGLTPMIGQNDTSNEVFTIKDAKGLNSFARSQGVGRMSMWSANRDITCGSNYVDLTVVSDSCSGVNEKGQSFASILSSGFKGNIRLSAGFITKSEKLAIANQAPDNPATSPYQIWSPTGAYLEGTKVVWHHNVYEAKWWTQGNVPDDPVLQSWQTPWQLIGPVLPGEKPIPQPTLPAGTYPNWSGTAIYNTGQRILFNNVPYQAKWWNQGQSPAAAASSPDSSPWAPLTQAQVNAITSASKVK